MGVNMEYKYFYTKDDFEFDLNINKITDTKIKRAFLIYCLILILTILPIIALVKKIPIKGFNILDVSNLLILLISISNLLLKLITIKFCHNKINESMTNDNQEEVFIEITDECIIQKEKEGVITYINWNKIKKIIKLDKYLNIIGKKNSVLAIPLRIFSNEEQNNFFELLKTKSKLLIQDEATENYIG
jgi:hypothetical protein